MRHVGALLLLVFTLAVPASSDGATLSLIARFTSREVGDTIGPICELVVPFTVTLNDSTTLMPSSSGETIAQFDDVSISGFAFPLTPPAGWSNPFPVSHTAYAQELRFPVPYAKPYSAGLHSAVVRDHLSQSVGPDRFFYHHVDLQAYHPHVFTTPDVGTPTVDSLVQLLMSGGWIWYEDFYSDYCWDFGCDPSWILYGTFEAAPSSAPTPEPSTAILALTGLVAALARRRYR